MRIEFTRRRVVSAALAIATAGAFGITTGAVGAVLASPAAAQASSTVGGTITRSEVLARAQYWVDQGYVYSPNAPTTYTWELDSSGKSYRADCSGLVSMAWHIDPSLVTGDFQAGGGPNHALASLNDLKPGDAIVRNGHIELFVKWGNYGGNHGAFVYSFNTNNETVQNPYADSNRGNRGFDRDSDMATYTPIRYDHIIDDPEPTAQSSGAVVFNSTLYEFARGTDGSIKYWFGNGGGWSSEQTIITNVTSDPVATVFNGNLYVFAIGTDGKVKYWFGSGNGWSTMQSVGDSVTGAVSSTVYNGTLYVFARGTDGAVKYWFGSGTGWSNTQSIVAAVTGGVSSAIFNGNLYVFGTAANGTVKYWFGSGNGWSTMQSVGDSASGPVSSTVNNGTLYVFARGTDGAVKYWFGSGTGWSTTQSLTGPVSGAISSVAFNGHLYAFARGTEGAVKYWFSIGGGWSTMQSFGGGLG
jgi:hypothetical protein